MSTLLDKLKEMVDEAVAKGDKAPTFDLCKVSVPGTNLFCTESMVQSRSDMPQLSGKPKPGTKADALPKNDKGEVDLSGPFVEQLASLGMSVTDEREQASYLRASQNELNGGKVAGMVSGMRSGAMKEGPIFVSRDNYVVDGHHRWAATVGVDLEDDVAGDVDMPVRRIDGDIVEVLALANEFALEMGIPQAAMTSRIWELVIR